MILMRIQGGFASQLIKYILGYVVATICETDYAIDIHDYAEGYFRPFVLNLLNITDIECVLSREYLNGFNEIKDGEELCKAIDNYNGERLYLSSEQVCYKEFFEKYSNRYSEIENELLNRLELLSFSNYYDNISKIIEECNTISVHVRRGDFVTLNWNDDTYEYKAAIGCLLKENPSAKVLFFSNDIEWTKNEFGLKENFIFIEKRTGYQSDIEDFFLLSKCRTKILSSKSGYSQYSWLIGKNKYGLNECLYIGKDEEDMVNPLIKKEVINFRHLKESEKEVGYGFFHRINEISQNTNIYKKSKEITRKEAIDLSYKKEDKISFWKKYYNTSLKKNKYLVITNEDYDKWKCNNILLLAAILSRLGGEVVLASRRKLIEEKNELIQFCNMDGEYLGFKEKSMSNILDYLKLILKYKYFKRFTVIYNLENKKIYNMIKNNIIFQGDEKKVNIFLREIDSPDDLFKISESKVLKYIKKYLKNE